MKKDGLIYTFLKDRVIAKDESGKKYLVVLYSPVYGGGMARGLDISVNTNPELVKLVFNNASDEELYEWFSKNNVLPPEPLIIKIAMIPIGTKFRVMEYDGSEYILTEDDLIEATEQ